MTRDLMLEIEDYCAEVGWKTSTFSRIAAGDGKFFKRIAAGGRCWPETVEKIRSYMADNPPKPTTAETTNRPGNKDAA